MGTVIYLHGLASSPASVKGVFFRPKLEALGFEVIMPDLNEPDFGSLTVSRALGQTLRLIDNVERGNRPLVLMGSSFGALLCALAAGRTPKPVEGLVLMAPAFDMEGLWRRQLGAEGVRQWERAGFVPVEHPAYDTVQRLQYGFFEDARWVDTSPPVLDQPCLVLHGKGDDVVDPNLALRFGELNPRAVVRMLDDGHDLLESREQMAAEVEAFLRREVSGDPREARRVPEEDT